MSYPITYYTLFKQCLHFYYPSIVLLLVLLGFLLYCSPQLFALPLSPFFSTRYGSCLQLSSFLSLPPAQRQLVAQRCLNCLCFLLIKVDTAPLKTLWPFCKSDWGLSLSPKAIDIIHFEVVSYVGRHLRPFIFLEAPLFIHGSLQVTALNLSQVLTKGFTAIPLI